MLGIDNESLLKGQLSCLEFVLSRSLRYRLDYYPSIDCQNSKDTAQWLAMATNLAASADTLLCALKDLPSASCQSSPYLVKLITLSALTGSFLYYSHPDCPSATHTRCCTEHRKDGFSLGLGILKQLFSRHPHIADPFKTIATFVASVLAVLENGEGPEAATAFRKSLDGVFDRLEERSRRKVDRTMEGIFQDISNSKYDVDLSRFEETLHAFLGKQAQSILEHPTLVDRFSDLITMTFDNRETGASSRTSNVQTPTGNKMLETIPGDAFRKYLVSDDLLTKIIHNTDSKVMGFLKDRAAAASPPSCPVDTENIPENQSHVSRLIDRHDSAIQLEWTQPLEPVECAMERVSAVNPSFTPRLRSFSPPPNPASTPGSAKRNGMRRPWTPQEVKFLIEGHARFGTDWRTIQAHFDFKDRTNVDLKDKYRNLLKNNRIVGQKQ